MTSTTSHLLFSPLSSTSHHHHPRHRLLHLPFSNLTPFSISPLQSTLIPHPHPHPHISALSAAGGGDAANFPPIGGGGGGRDDHNDNDNDGGSFWENFGIIGIFIRGWRERVSADPQFPFKVLMEEVVGVTSCVIGDMASRPNFGLNELDFVFSTLVVGSILNFTLMYLLAPTAAAAAVSSSFPSHFFQPGNFGVGSRVGSLVYKGALFAAVGFAAGLVGTAIGNGLITVRKRLDPEFETPNKAPPTVMNAVTWAGHMGLSSNLRYQTLNGVEYMLEKTVSPGVFKAAVVALRCANNLLGGVSFVALARLTGSQSVGKVADEEEEEEKVVVSEAVSLPSNHST
ncbi:hypothetical protein RND81_04G122000 [Saponaria officinalis]|uniref:Uncharacterized protein n=1 Tax=Saponaria officinalis TaxID=3572 RepID=A0AAW1LK67_SAPOF